MLMFMNGWFVHVPYSLDITPPSFISPHYYLLLIPPIYASLGLCDSDEREEGYTKV